jgi:multidrug efflux pump subunit AcrB
MYERQLPEDASTPTIIELNMDMMATMAISVTPTGDVDLLNYVNENVVPEFEKLGGVASVNVNGGQQDYIKSSLFRKN